MKKSRSVFACLLIVLFCMTVFTPTISVTVGLSELSVPAETETTVANDGDSGVITIPVWKNEQVLNGSGADTNHHGITNLGGLWVGVDGTSGLARSFVSFDLKHLAKETAFVSARLFAFMSGDFNINDTPIAVYYCADSSWEETLITWNNQPSASASPSDIIDSPGSPDTFILNNWYSWDVTSDVRTALAGDKLLTELIKNVDENAVPGTGKGFAKKEYYQFNATYLELSYTTPVITEVAVDGHSSGPLLDYIQDDTPLMSWTHYDQDSNDFQYGYQIEVWDDPIYNETLLWSDSSSSILPVFYDNTSINARPYNTDSEMRFQYKYDNTILNQSGTVDKLHFYVVGDEGVLTLENLVVRLASSTIGTFSSDFEANFAGAEPITVLRHDAYEATIHDSILTIDVENTFVLNHDLHLVIELRFTGLSGTFAWSEYEPSSAVGYVAYSYGAGAYTAFTATIVDQRCYSFDVELASEEIHQSSSPSTNAYPFGTEDNEYGRVVLKFNNSLIQQAGYIDKIFFRLAPGGTDVVYEDFEIYLCETPVEGKVDHIDWSYNYGEVTPTRVMNEASYTVRNLGTVMILDVDNTFYFNNELNLLIELRWGNKTSGLASILETSDEGGYRAWDCFYFGSRYEGNGTRTYDMFVDFVQPESELEYDGLPLVDGTRYYSRARTCDSTGIWTSWSELDFKYEVLTSAPDYEGPIITPSPVPLGSEVEVAVNVTYFLGINEVVIEYGGSNHTMNGVGDSYSLSWTPSAAGTVNFTIYMESNVRTWSSVDGSFVVGGFAIDPLLLVLIGGGIVVVLVLVIVMKKKGGK
ncbi:MAG: DNRLRE domain-containing protein [Candidatus Thorarchaeota archaeon]